MCQTRLPDVQLKVSTENSFVSLVTSLHVLDALLLSSSVFPIFLQ